MRQAPESKGELTPSLLLTMAVASGVPVANIYYNQPMLADMASALHVSPHEIGYVATARQIGYAAGMPMFISLGDFWERRGLIFLLFIANLGPPHSAVPGRHSPAYWGGPDTRLERFRRRRAARFNAERCCRACRWLHAAL